MPENSYKENRQIRPIGGAVTVYGISIPWHIVRDLKREFDLEKTFFKIEYDENQRQILLTSGCRPPKL